MRITIACAGFLLAFLHSFSAGQTHSLDIGMPAPALHSNAWIQGTPVSEFQKGQVYVLNFWNSGYSAFGPELSRLSPEMKAGIHFISINTMERWTKNKDTGEEARLERIQGLLRKEKSALPFCVCVDDASNSLFSQWVPIDGSYRLPKAVIVDQKSEVAWIGNPWDMERPLTQIWRGLFDKVGFKQQFDVGIAKMAADRRIAKDIEEAAKDSDPNLVDGLALKLNRPGGNATVSAIYYATTGNPEFGLTYLKAKLNRLDDVWSSTWCYLLAHIAECSKLASTRQEALTISARCLKDCRNDELPIAEAYHAEILAAAGQRDEALITIGKAKADVSRINGGWRDRTMTVVDNIRNGIR
jgi:hypothetical protein